MTNRKEETTEETNKITITCKWELPDGMFRKTGCDEKIYEEYKGVNDGYKYCPYCGKEIEEVKDGNN